MLIGGQDVYAPEQYPVSNPAHREQILAFFQLGTPASADLALQAARAALPVWRATALAGAGVLTKEGGRFDRSERTMIWRRPRPWRLGKIGWEAAGDVFEAPALIRYTCGCAAGERPGICSNPGRGSCSRLPGPEYFHPAALRGLAGDQPLRFSDCLTREPGGAGVGRRQYGGDQARRPHTLERAFTGGVFPGGRFT